MGILYEVLERTWLRYANSIRVHWYSVRIVGKLLIFYEKLVKQFKGECDMKMDKVAGSGNDEFYTPEYAITPIAKYLVPPPP